MHAIFPLLIKTNFPTVRRSSFETLQVNLGYQCNQSCQHCHVNAGPNRTEMMDSATIDIVIEVLKQRQIATLDLTGGAPELNVHFRRLVKQAREIGVRVIDRCNLTILLEDGQSDLAQFLANHEVEITASLPCYSKGRVDRQRGDGVFERSIQALRKLNALGYGSKLILNLVYNPQGPSLPPNQDLLEQDYRRELSEMFGIKFSRLFALTNMPIQRFGSMLVSKNQFNSYMNLLKENFNSENLEGLMCKSTISVDYQGNLFDCDFNQMLRMPMKNENLNHMKLQDLLSIELVNFDVNIADHCYGCTAGQGSSCSGSLDAANEVML